MRKRYLITLSIIILFLLPNITLAQWTVPGAGEEFLKWLFGPNIPQEWLQPYKALQFLVFPFVMLFLIFFGILLEIRIFRRYPIINGLIALFWAFMASYTGALVVSVHLMMSIAGFWGFFVFWFLLILGIYAFAVWRLRGWGFKRWGFTAEIMETEKKLVEWRDYQRRCLEAGMTTEAEVARKKIEQLEKDLGSLRKKKLPGERPG
ncbi:MAG: hypothetical protein ACE5KE_02455 [Methanosarcinales archaeon]